MTERTAHLHDQKTAPNGTPNGADHKRCLIYLRVSSREQAEEGYSISAQREACRKLIDDRGWTFVDEYVDAGESARTADRPAFQTMLDRLTDDRSITCLVVHKLDRLARNLEDHVTVTARLRKLGVQLVSVTESLEESASGKLVEGILASIAEFYSANLAQEIRKGLREKARQGGWPAAAPIGYRNLRTAANGRRSEAIIVPDQDQAQLVRQAFELYATGEWPLSRLHEEMERRGLRTDRGTPVSRSNLAKLLQNRIYLGKVIWEGIEYEGIHEPLVSPELFGRVQEVFRLHDRAGVRQRRHNHYLRGTVFCGSCGARLSSQTAKKRFTYFYCLGAQQKRTSCHEPYAPAADLERQVENLYRKIRLSHQFRIEVERALEQTLAARDQERARTRQLWARRLARLATEQDKLLRAHYEDAIPLPLLKKEQRRIEAETRNAKQQLAAQREKQLAARDTVQLARTLLTDLHRAYTLASPLTRRRYSQSFFKAVYVRNRQIVGVDYAEPFDRLLGADRRAGARAQATIKLDDARKGTIVFD